MFKLFWRMLEDLWLAKFQKSKELRGFAFVVHPRDYGDVVSNLKFLKKIPRSWIIRYFSMMWPFTLSRITGVKSLVDGRELPGWVIGVPIFAHEMMENREGARRKISRGIRLAKSRGAKIVGLGGLTGSITEGGAGLYKVNGVSVTAGRAYTAFVVKSYVDDVVQKYGLNKADLSIAVVGAAGGVGTAVSRLVLKENYKKIYLIDLERKLHHVFDEHGLNNVPSVEITHLIGKVREADIIVTVTNAPEAVVENDDIMPGTIIVDDAQPSDISKEIIDSRRDILVIEAGVLTAHDSIRTGTNFRLANKDEIYCCLGEVMAVAASDWEGEYQPREISPELIAQISHMATGMGFKLAPYQAYGKMVPQEQIDAVGSIIKEKIASRS